MLAFMFKSVCFVLVFQTQEQHVQHQSNLEARLAELEVLLQNLNTRTTVKHTLRIHKRALFSILVEIIISMCVLVSKEIHLNHESPAPATIR